MRTQHDSGVELLRWPAERKKRERFRAQGLLRLLVVEGGAPPPVSEDIREDWIRAPITERDLMARVETLRAKALKHCAPRIDSDGIVRCGSRSVAVSPTEAAILQLLTRNFGMVVSREALCAQLSAAAGRSSRNALDLHIMRIRRRIAGAGLAIRTAWGRGYLLISDDYRCPLPQ